MELSTCFHVFSCCLVNAFLSLSLTSRRKIEQTILCIWLKCTLSLPFSETKLVRKLVRCSAKDARQSWVRISIQGLEFTLREPIYLTDFIFPFSLLFFHCYFVCSKAFQSLFQYCLRKDFEICWWYDDFADCLSQAKTSPLISKIYGRKKAKTLTIGHVCDL